MSWSFDRRSVAVARGYEEVPRSDFSARLSGLFRVDDMTNSQYSVDKQAASNAWPPPTGAVMLCSASTRETKDHRRSHRFRDGRFKSGTRRLQLMFE